MWYHLYIENPDIALAKSKLIMNAVDALLTSTQNNEVALFSKLDDRYSGVHYYFTPPTQAVAVAFGASLCEKPSKQMVGGLLVGNQAVVSYIS